MGLKILPWTRKLPANFISRYLGRTGYHELIDAFQLAELLRELGWKHKRYSEVRDKILNGEYKLGVSEDLHLRPGLRAGEITFNVGQVKARSFYRVAFSDEKTQEIEKDFEVSKYLCEHSEGKVKVPRPVFKAGQFTATELIRGGDFTGVLKTTDRKRIEKTLCSLVEQAYSWHGMSVDNPSVHKMLDEKKPSDFYNLGRFLRELNPEAVAAGSFTALQTEWAKRIDEPLGAMPKGIMHNDLHSRNIKLGRHGMQVIDWGDACYGPIAYDLARALMTTGFSTYANEECLDEKLDRILSAQTHGYNRAVLHDSIHRANASIRMRLARSVLASVKSIKQLDVELSEKDQKLVENFASFHYTMGLRAVRMIQEPKYVKESLESQLQAAIQGSGISELSSAELAQFIRDYNPDINGSSALDRIKKSVACYKADEQLQEADVRSRVIKRRAKNSLAVTLAACLVAGVSGLLYKKYVQPIAEELHETQAAVETLVQQYEPDLTERQIILQRVEEGIITKWYKIVPAAISYLGVPFSGNIDGIGNLWKEFVKKKPQIKPSQDIGECLRSEKKINCPPFYDWSAKESRQVVKGLKEKMSSSNLSIKPFLRRTVLQEVLSPQDYYGERDLAQTVSLLDGIYFGLPVLYAVGLSDPENFTAHLQALLLKTHQKDNRLNAHLLAQKMQENIRRRQSIELAYLDLFCTPDDMVLMTEPSQALWQPDSGFPCVEQSREAYFTLLKLTGLDPQLLSELHSDMEQTDQIKNLVRAKTTQTLGGWNVDEITEITTRYAHNTLKLVRTYLDWLYLHLGHRLKTVNDARATGREKCFDDYEPYLPYCSCPVDPVFEDHQKFGTTIYAVVESARQNQSLARRRTLVRDALRYSLSNASIAQNLSEIEIFNERYWIGRFFHEQMPGVRFCPGKPGAARNKDEMLVCLQAIQTMEQACYELGVISEGEYKAFTSAHSTLLDGMVNSYDAAMHPILQIIDYGRAAQTVKDLEEIQSFKR